MVIGDKEQEKYVGITFIAISPDGKTAAYIALDYDEEYECEILCMVIGDKKYETPSPTSKPVFLDNSTICYFAKSGKDICRITRKVK